MVSPQPFFILQRFLPLSQLIPLAAQKFSSRGGTGWMAMDTNCYPCPSKSLLMTFQDLHSPISTLMAQANPIESCSDFKHHLFIRDEASASPTTPFPVQMSFWVTETLVFILPCPSDQPHSHFSVPLPPSTAGSMMCFVTPCGACLKKKKSGTKDVMVHEFL